MGEQEEKFDEKEMEKHEEKSAEEKSYEEKYRNDPLGAIIWAVILIWVGIVLLADNLGYLERLDMRFNYADLPFEIPFVQNSWSLIFLGIGVIVLFEIMIRLLIPDYRRPLMGSVILPGILIISGSSVVFGWAKPVPINLANLRNRWWGNMAVSLAGVSANLALAGVALSLLEQHGAVSSQVARAMAEGARRAAGADYALSVTGIAGPSGGSPEKPVGLVYVAVADAEGVEAEEFHFFGGREAIRERARVAALDHLRRRLLEQG